MKKIFILASAIISITFAASCKTSKKAEMKPNPIIASDKVKMENEFVNSSLAFPQVFVYKMKKDYSNNVPVIMDNGRTRIVSYPAPTDLKRGNGYATPTKLNDGFWLDNKGIGPNVAFLSYTYEEYAALEQAPAIENLMKSIIDKNPLEYYAFCGRRNNFKDIIKEINLLIDNGKIYSMGPTVCPEPEEKSGLTDK